MNCRLLIMGIALTLVLCAGQSAGATTLAAFQEPQTQTPKPAGSVGLTDDQRAKMKSIHESTRDQMRALRNDQSLTPEQRHEKARSIREATRQQVLGVLTPQQQELVKNRMERRGELGERQGNRGPGRGFEKGFGRGQGRDALGLSAEQRTQLNSIHENTRNQVSAIRNDTTLSAEQKVEKIRSLHQSTRQQVSTILTPEQQQRIREHRGPEGGRRGFRRGAPFGPRREL
jgi:Spy/CpxP family protein refolding chaperone